MTLDQIIHQMNEEANGKSQAESSTLIPEDPRGWVEQQLASITDVAFAPCSDSRWEASELVRNSICKLSVSVQDGWVEVAEVTPIYPTEASVAQIRMFQMYLNGNFKVRGFSKAEVGKPIEFRTRFRVTTDLPLENVIGAAAFSVKKYLPTFKRIQEGVATEEAYREEAAEKVMLAIRKRGLL